MDWYVTVYWSGVRRREKSIDFLPIWLCVDPRATFILITQRQWRGGRKEQRCVILVLPVSIATRIIRVRRGQAVDVGSRESMLYEIPCAPHSPFLCRRPSVHHLVWLSLPQTSRLILTFKQFSFVRTSARRIFASTYQYWSHGCLSETSLQPPARHRRLPLEYFLTNSLMSLDFSSLWESLSFFILSDKFEFITATADLLLLCFRIIIQFAPGLPSDWFRVRRRDGCQSHEFGRLLSGDNWQLSIAHNSSLQLLW